MRFSRLAPAVVALAIALTIPAAACAQAGTLRQQVDSLHVAMVAAFKADPASVTKFYTDDASIMGGGGRHVGRTQLDEYWKQAAMFADWKLEVLEVGGGMDAPWVRGRSTITSKSGGSMVTEYVGILKRQGNGALRFYVDIFVGTLQRRPGDAR